MLSESKIISLYCIVDEIYKPLDTKKTSEEK